MIKKTVITGLANPLLLKTIYKFMEKNTGKKFLTQGKLRESTGNFISAGIWPP